MSYHYNEETITKIMRANKSTETKPEQVLRKKMWKVGLKGYRKNYKGVLGKPDVVFIKKKSQFS